VRAGVVDECMAHRYLYYVESAPVISDVLYDRMEREARLLVGSRHPLHRPGSSLASSYPPHIVHLAGELKMRCAVGDAMEAT